MVEIAMVTMEGMLASWFFMFLKATIPSLAMPSALRKGQFHCKSVFTAW